MLAIMVCFSVWTSIDKLGLWIFFKFKSILTNRTFLEISWHEIVRMCNTNKLKKDLLKRFFVFVIFSWSSGLLALQRRWSSLVNFLEYCCFCCWVYSNTIYYLFSTAIFLNLYCNITYKFCINILLNFSLIIW